MIGLSAMKGESDPMKKLSALFLCLCLIAGIVPVTAENTEAAAAGTSMKETLENIPGVISVEVIEPAEGSVLFSERYLVIFDQPLDWKDPSKGTFPQRVLVNLSDDAEINVLETQGYCLTDYQYPESVRQMVSILGMDAIVSEMTGLVTKSGNYICVEHRFFGGSRPADLSNTGLKYWEYHTPENAANDLHSVYSALAPLLGERWVSVGTSRGGLMTNVYAKYFPEDMDVYIPYVAPCSDGITNDNMYRFVYEEIGDAAYGKETAEKYRGIVTDFQVELMKNKEVLLPYLVADIEAQGMLFQNGPEDYGRVYDLAVLELAVQTWQYKGKQMFGDMQMILGMPEDTDELKNQKLQQMIQVFATIQGFADFSYNFVAWPYYVNTATYYGQYLYDFSWLRQAMEKAGVENTLSISPEADQDIPWSIVFTAEQREAFVYDGTFREELLEDMKTTKAKHLMIFGACDPWISEAVPEEITDGNENIRRYINPDYPHDSLISNMPEDMKNEIISLLKEWLSIQ